MRDFVEVDEDHISICKPPSPDTNTYLYLKQYIQDALKQLEVRGVVVRLL
jgi:phosphatidylserine/phosphatidylglycerophosphate/cardiolipin synthase-like enzyme